jgi:hypothetical protein
VTRSRSGDGTGLASPPAVQLPGKGGSHPQGCGLSPVRSARHRQWTSPEPDAFRSGRCDSDGMWRQGTLCFAEAAGSSGKASKAAPRAAAHRSVRSPARDSALSSALSSPARSNNRWKCECQCETLVWFAAWPAEHRWEPPVPGGTAAAAVAAKTSSSSTERHTPQR